MNKLSPSRSHALFERVLIANRGEVAQRIMRTCRRLGIETVAVYSDADVGALHTREADQAMRIGPASAADSYLRIEAIIEAAIAAGADAIHPGYGFLSENALFASACAAAGVIFIGPSADVLTLLGDKLQAKQLATSEGVPVARWQLVHGESGNHDHVTLPAIVKPLAGGGGKGMHLVTEAAELNGAIALATREASAAFGDPRVMIEQLVQNARHIEVQFIADANGNVVHLGDRDCSIQRRHQKLIEEAPAPNLAASLRETLADHAIRLARASNYSGAGTAEFLVTADDAHYFLEVNARLQVEHPVTEMVTQLDLVELQLRVAAGEALPISQDDVRCEGHAIEARLYAEDPYEGFLPRTGVLGVVEIPDLPDTRADLGIETGSEVTPHYDPMLGKLCAWGPKRDDALDRLGDLIAQTVVLGTTTNLEFLSDVLGRDDVRGGGLSTTWLETTTARKAPLPHDVASLAAVSWVAGAEVPGAPEDPWVSMGARRPAGHGIVTVTLDAGDGPIATDVRRDGDDWVVQALGPARPVLDDGLVGGLRRVRLDDRWLVGQRNRDGLWIHAAGTVSPVFNRRIDVLGQPRRADPRGHGGHDLTAPLPGTVLQVLVQPGESVSAGTPMVIVEAMKMEHIVRAPVSGVVPHVHVRAGDRVTSGQALVEFSTDDELG